MTNQHHAAAALRPWDAADIKQPHWDHVFAAFVAGAKEARANPDADEYIFGRAADAHTKRVLEEIDPASEHALRTGTWSVETAAAAPHGDLDAGLALTIDQRDTAEGWADGLAALIGKYFGRDIGEHSSAHCPWQEAKEIIAEAEPYRPAAVAPQHPPMPEKWSVVVSVGGENILCIGDSHLSGREPSEIEEQAIIGVAQHLLSFVGYAPPPSDFDRDAEPSRHSAPCFSVDATAMLDQIKKLAEELIKLSAKAQVASSETPAAPAEPAVVTRRMLRSKAERDVIDERRRQVSVEGCSTKLDDVYQGSELALAAAWYATPPFTRFALDANDMSLWPISWLPTSFKPGDRRRELVKSGALIIAELERLDREAAQAKESGAA